MSQIVDQIHAQISSRRLLDHPFYVAWSKGELTREALQKYAEQYYQWVYAFPTWLSSTHANATDFAMRQEMLENLIDEERGPDNHPELWLRFGEGLRLNREDILRSSPSPLMQVVLDAERFRSMSQRIGGLPSNMRLGERINAVVYPIWADALEEKYGVPRDALDFFTAHGEADEDHGEIGRQIVMSRATDFETQQRIWAHHEASQAKQWINYDVFYQAALKVGRLTPA